MGRDEKGYFCGEMDKMSGKALGAPRGGLGRSLEGESGTTPVQVPENYIISFSSMVREGGGGGVPEGGGGGR